MINNKIDLNNEELISFCECQIKGKKEELKLLSKNQKFGKLILENEIETYNKIISILRGE